MATMRWLWRQLTSMRVALILLFLLALASIPGSIFPQRGTSPLRVNEFLQDNPTWGPILDQLFMFDVFASGAVENIRHLHNFQKEHQSILGSRNENLGKKFMIHLLTKFPHIDSPTEEGFEFERKQGLNYKRTVQLKRNFQEKYGLANSLGTFSPGEVNLLNIFFLYLESSFLIPILFKTKIFKAVIAFKHI